MYEFYGVDLMRELKIKEYLYCLSRWLLKELLLIMVKVILGKVELVELFNIFISLLNGRVRILG